MSLELIANRALALVWGLIGVSKIPTLIEMLKGDWLSNMVMVWVILNGFWFLIWRYWTEGPNRLD